MWIQPNTISKRKENWRPRKLRNRKINRCQVEVFAVRGLVEQNVISRFVGVVFLCIVDRWQIEYLSVVFKSLERKYLQKPCHCLLVFCIPNTQHVLLQTLGPRGGCNSPSSSIPVSRLSTIVHLQVQLSEQRSHQRFKKLAYPAFRSTVMADLSLCKSFRAFFRYQSLDRVWCPVEGTLPCLKPPSVW